MKTVFSACIVLALASHSLACGGGGSFFGGGSYFGGCGANYFGGCETTVNACAPIYSSCGSYGVSGTIVSQSGCGDCAPVEKTYRSVPVRPEATPQKVPMPEETLLPIPNSENLPTAPAIPGKQTNYRLTSARMEVLPGNIVVHLPADAQLWINGHATTSKGKIREYEVLMETGRDYKFEIVARLGDKQATRTVVLRAGETKEVR